MKAKLFCAVALCLLSVGVTYHASAETVITTGSPCSGCGGLFWIDPTQSVFDPPEYQIWGNVLTTPANTEVLSSLSLYVFSQAQGATNFGVDIFAWSSSLAQPIGPTLYQSAMVSLPNQNSPVTTFFPNLMVTAGDQYIVEVVGNGLAGIDYSFDTSNIRLYEYQSDVGTAFINWPYALASTVTFDAPATTPLITTIPLFATGLGVMGLLGWRRKRSAKISLRRSILYCPKRGVDWGLK